MRIMDVGLIGGNCLKGNRKLAMAIIAVALGLSGCKDNQTLADETLPVESVDEEEDVLDAESVDKAESPAVEMEQQKEEDDDVMEKEVNDDTTEKEKNDDVPEKKENNDVPEKKKAVLTYKGDALLTEANIEQVLKDFLTIADEDDLKKLEKLPLTENFFNQCAEDFPYIGNVEKYKEINIDFWSVDEKGKFVSIVTFVLYENKKNESFRLNGDHVYCIEMDIVGYQIDAMKIELMR